MLPNKQSNIAKCSIDNINEFIPKIIHLVHGEMNNEDYRVGLAETFKRALLDRNIVHNFRGYLSNAKSSSYHYDLNSFQSRLGCIRRFLSETKDISALTILRYGNGYYRDRFLSEIYKEMSELRSDEIQVKFIEKVRKTGEGRYNVDSPYDSMFGDNSRDYTLETPLLSNADVFVDNGTVNEYRFPVIPLMNIKTIENVGICNSLKEHKREPHGFFSNIPEENTVEYNSYSEYSGCMNFSILNMSLDSLTSCISVVYKKVLSDIMRLAHENPDILQYLIGILEKVLGDAAGFVSLSSIDLESETYYYSITETSPSTILSDYLFEKCLHDSNKVAEILEEYVCRNTHLAFLMLSEIVQSTPDESYEAEDGIFAKIGNVKESIISNIERLIQLTSISAYKTYFAHVAIVNKNSHFDIANDMFKDFADIARIDMNNIIPTVGSGTESSVANYSFTALTKGNIYRKRLSSFLTLSEVAEKIGGLGVHSSKRNASKLYKLIYDLLQHIFSEKTITYNTESQKVFHNNGEIRLVDTTELINVAKSILNSDIEFTIGLQMENVHDDVVKACLLSGFRDQGAFVRMNNHNALCSLYKAILYMVIKLYNYSKIAREYDRADNKSQLYIEKQKEVLKKQLDSLSTALEKFLEPGRISSSFSIICNPEFVSGSWTVDNATPYISKRKNESVIPYHTSDLIHNYLSNLDVSNSEVTDRDKDSVTTITYHDHQKSIWEYGIDRGILDRFESFRNFETELFTWLNEMKISEESLSYVDNIPMLQSQIEDRLKEKEDLMDVLERPEIKMQEPFELDMHVLAQYSGDVNDLEKEIESISEESLKERIKKLSKRFDKVLCKYIENKYI